MQRARAGTRLGRRPMDLFQGLLGRAGRGLHTGLAIGAEERLTASVQERPPFLPTGRLP